MKKSRTVVLCIDLDAICKRCGKGGAVGKSGICMGCMTKAVQAGELDHIIKKRKAT